MTIQTTESMVARFLTDVLPGMPGRNFRHNPVQVQYAASISRSLAGGAGTFNFVEGDTGIGKSLAYLLTMGDWVARGLGVGRQAVIATHSRALQRQLLSGENREVLNDYLTWAELPALSMGLRMGRNNYVAPHRLAQALEVSSLERLMDDPSANPRHVSLACWAMDGGLLHELTDDALPEGVSLKDIALHPSDPMPEALREAFDTTAACDIQVINHTLLALDLVQGGRITGASTPSVFMVDEAEHYPSAAESVLSDSLSLWMIALLLEQHGKREVSRQWKALFEAWRDLERAGQARLLEPGHREVLVDALNRLIRIKPAAWATPEMKHELSEVRELARRVRDDLRNGSERVVMSYSPERGYPSVVGLDNTAGATLRIGNDQRITLLTSATLSDLKHQPGQPPSFEYLRRRLLIPAGSDLLNVMDSHQALNFGELTIRLPGLGLPVMVKDELGYVLNPAFAEAVWEDVVAVGAVGRMLLLCTSYRDVGVMVDAAPAELADRLLTHDPGAPLNELAEAMPEDGILLTPAGWEGLSPRRKDETFWSHVGIVRNPTPRPDPVKALVLERHLLKKMPRANAQRTASASLSVEGQVATLHKLRQGIGRAIRHPLDVATVTLYDSRFPTSRLESKGIKQLEWLAGAIPFRFRESLHVAQRDKSQPEKKKMLML